MSDKQDSKKQRRQAREAEALRANLQRRKAQQREQRLPGGTGRHGKTEGDLNQNLDGHDEDGESR